MFLYGSKQNEGHEEMINSGLNLDELKDLYRRTEDATVEKSIVKRAAQLIAENDSDYDPESGELEPDYLAAAKDFLDRE